MGQKAVLLKQKAISLLLVKVAVAGLNGHDQMVCDMGIFLGKIGLPAVLANDVVGKVVTVGSHVTTFHKGDRVVSQADFGSGTPQNGLQEYAVLNEQFTARIPDSVTDGDAATLPTNIIASLVALFHDLPIPAPWTQDAEDFDYAATTLLIIGGGSVAGRYAVQLAKLAGIGWIVVVGGKDDKLKEYGATHVIDRHGSQDVVLDRIRQVVGDDLIYAYDVVNMPDGQLLALNALSSHTKGFFTRLLPMPIDESKVLGKKAGFEVKSVLGISSERPELCRKFWKRLPEYLEEGKIVLIPEGYPVISGLDAAKINGVLDGFQRQETLKHAHVHL
ncbi:hypothetical protein M409DRAFT_70712 [Zasmidium cellare ATCC 36951]|uniref:Enoyl reductase (ER) domain-containing protein n=1 Tax=Zasmidium cellare ATCC 36951 TaxID=1080233 RepID=A0A6A6C2M4_ZASCE|nr:uncharacterized protein M409DRAFT_70712 [Zasmidium cellare ATCC 36951]KAF2159979.1 hypothetical protein M409DRAFT_70712 [Zasmidium cellare ATCC 36951]